MCQALGEIVTCSTVNMIVKPQPKSCRGLTISIPQWEPSCQLLLDSSNRDLQIFPSQISRHYTHARPCMVHQLVQLIQLPATAGIATQAVSNMPCMWGLSWVRYLEWVHVWLQCNMTTCTAAASAAHSEHVHVSWEQHWSTQRHVTCTLWLKQHTHWRDGHMGPKQQVV